MKITDVSYGCFLSWTLNLGEEKMKKSVLALIVLAILAGSLQTAFAQEIIKKQNKVAERELSATDWVEKGIAVGKSGFLDEALDAFTKAIELNPKYAEAYCYRGMAYGIFEEHHQAIMDYDKAIELNPKYAEAYYNRGVTYGADLSKHHQAIMDFTKVIELSKIIDLKPPWLLSSAYYNRGYSYFNLDRRQQAIDDYKIAARMGHFKAKLYLDKWGVQW